MWRHVHIVDRAAIYIMVVKFWNTICTPPPQLSHHRRAALSSNSNGTRSVYSIEIRLNRKETYILADIHGMDHFYTKLAPPPYNKPRRCVSKIHTPMVMVWFGNVLIFNKVEFPTVLIYVTSEKIRKKAWWQHRRARCPWLGRLLIVLAHFLLIVWFLWYIAERTQKAVYIVRCLRDSLTKKLARWVYGALV
jgi:hypothetical protein